MAINDLVKLVGSSYSDARTKKGTLLSKIASSRLMVQSSTSFFQSGRSTYTMTRSLVAQTRFLDGVLKARKRIGNEPAKRYKEPIAAEDWSKLQLYFQDMAETVDTKAAAIDLKQGVIKW